MRVDQAGGDQLVELGLPQAVPGRVERVGHVHEAALGPDRARRPPGPKPEGRRSVRNRPMTSPATVRSSSPTTTRHGSWSASAVAPLIVPWSVMQSTSMPAASTAASSSSGVVVASPDHMVWACRSTRTQPAGGAPPRWGWRSAAMPTEGTGPPEGSRAARVGERVPGRGTIAAVARRGLLRAVPVAVPVSRTGVALWAWRNRTRARRTGPGSPPAPSPGCRGEERGDVIAEARLRARLTNDPRTRGVDGLRVDVADGVATLTGRGDPEVHDAALAIATDTGASAG